MTIDQLRLDVLQSALTALFWGTGLLVWLFIAIALIAWASGKLVFAKATMVCNCSACQTEREGKRA